MAAMTKAMKATAMPTPIQAQSPTYSPIPPGAR